MLCWVMPAVHFLIFGFLANVPAVQHAKQSIGHRFITNSVLVRFTSQVYSRHTLKHDISAHIIPVAILY